MAEDSIREEIASLTDRIRREGQLDRNGKNSLKAVIEGNAVVSIKLDVTNDLLGSIKGMLSDFIGDAARRDRTDNGFTPGGGSGQGDPTPDDSEDPKDKKGGLGLLGIGAAALIGTVGGIIAGQIKAVQAIAKLFEPTKLYQRIAKSLTSLSKGITTTITNLKTSIVDTVKNIGKSVRAAFAGLGGLGQGGTLSKLVGQVTGRLAPVIGLFTDAIKTISDVVGKVASNTGKSVKFFAQMASKFSLFRILVKTIGAAVSKIFAPIAIIITVFDTIKGIIDGFLSEGITGAIEGGITGFFNSLIFGPLDMLKSAAAWVLGFFGFDNAKKALNSFSFATIFSDLIGGIFEPLHGIKDLIMSMFSSEGPTAMESIGRILGGLWDIVVAPFQAVIDLVSGIFSLAGFELPEFSIKEFINGVVGDAIGFVKGIFGFGGDDLEADVAAQEALVRKTRTADAVGVSEDGTVSLANRTVNGLNDVRGAEANLESRGVEVLNRDERAALVAEQEAELERRRAALAEFQNRPNIMQIVSEGASNAIEWVKGLFSFDSAGDMAASAVNAMFLPANIAWKAFTSIGSWIAGLFGFDAASETLAEVGEYSIGELVMNTLDKIWIKLKEVFDFFPSIEEIKSSLMSMLPSWMRPDTVEEQKASIEAEIETEQARIDRSNSGENEYYGSEESGREGSLEKIKELEQKLSELPQANRGGIINAPESGTPVMLHGQEAIIPLDNPKAQSYLTGMTAVTQAASVSARPANNSMVSNSGNNIDNSSRQTTTTYVSPSAPRVGPDPAAV